MSEANCLKRLIYESTKKEGIMNGKEVVTILRGLLREKYRGEEISAKLEDLAEKIQRLFLMECSSEELRGLVERTEGLSISEGEVTSERIRSEVEREWEEL